MLKTYTYALYPTPAQAARLFHYLYVGRKIYNDGLAQRIAYYKETGESLSYMTQTADLTILRSVSQVLADVPVAIERDALDRLDKAYSNFFRRVKEGSEKPGFPRFKSADRWNSFAIAKPARVIRHGCKIYVSGVGLISGRNVRQFTGVAKTLRVLFKAGKWFAQVVTDDGREPPPLQPVQSVIGIDVGLESFATLSTGEKIENPRFFRKLERKLARAQRNVSRKVKGSRNRRKAIRHVRRVHAAIQNQRSNFTHHLSKRIVAEHQLIAVEALNINGMVRGRLAKSILDAAWGQFIFQLAYKAEEAGCLLVKVNPRGTSQHRPPVRGLVKPVDRLRSRGEAGSLNSQQCEARAVPVPPLGPRRHDIVDRLAYLLKQAHLQPESPQPGQCPHAHSFARDAHLPADSLQRLPIQIVPLNGFPMLGREYRQQFHDSRHLYSNGFRVGRIGFGGRGQFADIGGMVVRYRVAA